VTWIMPEWVPGLKHPMTPRTVFMNCYEIDKVRRVLMARCKICGHTVSKDEKAVKELMYRCDKSTFCGCGEFKTHQVCSLCYDMFHALYANYLMKNRNYFKDMDDKRRAEWEGYKKRENGTT
jgi:hypothetical protein